MQQSSRINLLRLPRAVLLTLLLTLALTFTACGGGNPELDSPTFEDGVDGNGGLSREDGLDDGGLDDGGLDDGTGQ